MITMVCGFSCAYASMRTSNLSAFAQCPILMLNSVNIISIQRKGWVTVHVVSLDLHSGA